MPKQEPTDFINQFNPRGDDDMKWMEPLNSNDMDTFRSKRFSEFSPRPDRDLDKYH